MRYWFRAVVISSALCSVAVLGASLVDFRFAMLAGIPILAGWLASLLISFIAAAISVIKSRYEGLLFPLIPIALFFVSIFAVPYVQYPEDYLHFRSMRSSYDAVVERQPRNGHRFAEFNWGGMLYASDGVVYDETDEIARPVGSQSVAWRRRVPYDVTCGTNGPIGKVLPLGQHYYVVGFGC